jgi:hypothetical protein
LSETLYAYLAAAIDLDGYIRINRLVRPSRVRTHYFVPIIGIANNSPMIPDLFGATFPGRRKEFRSKNPKHPGFHWWEAQFHLVNDPLLCLMPHLRIKRRQAELTLSLLGLTVRKYPAISPDASLIAEQEQATLYEEVCRLNGPRPELKFRTRRLKGIDDQGALKRYGASPQGDHDLP